MARPKKPINEDLLVARAERGWSMRQIAAAFGVNESLIRRRYAAKIEDARHHGAAKLMDILWVRGVNEKSDRILENLTDRIMGPRPKAPDQEGQRQTVSVQVTQYHDKLTPAELTEEIHKEQKLLTKGDE